jgi:alpha-beta hydrolase superfamily lysophospholipase
MRCWLTTPVGAMAASIHVSRDLSIRPRAVLICPPFGYEYTHAHRSLVHLADELAAAGFLAMRVDYIGTGDSEGDADTPNLFEGWVEGVAEAARRLTEIVAAPPTLVGLRFGALMTGLAATRVDVEHLVAWHPVSSGKRYVREYLALGRVAGSSSGSGNESERLEAGGFVLARATREALEDADLVGAALRVSGQALVLDRDDLGPEERLARHLGTRGIRTEMRAVPGYLGMMAEPQYTVVPSEAIATIVSWLDEKAPRDRSYDVGNKAFVDTIETIEATWGPPRARVRESHLLVAPNGERLIGVLSEPALGPEQPRSEGTAVVFANSGSVHHVGPNRLYVELARALAGAGVASFRIDLRNLGDSRTGDCPHENHPYPPTAVEDVRVALDHLASYGYTPFVVAGLCSGAHAAFHAGLELESRAIVGVICINPLTFQWHEGMSLDTPDSHRTTRDAQYYGGAVRDFAKWKKLLTGRADLGYIARFAIRRARDLVRRRVRRAAEWAHLRDPGELGQRLERYRASGRQLGFIFSANDPSYAILTSEAGPSLRRLYRLGVLRLDFVDGADHTFSREAWRLRACEAVIGGVRAMGTTAPIA